MAGKMRLGELAVARGFVRREELEDALRAQEELFREGKDRRLGEILIEKGHLRDFQLEALLKAQEGAGRKRIGPYELLSRLGEGGMGAVYKARDERTGRLVALKVLPRKLAQDAGFVARFEREGRIGLKLDHANVVRTLEVGEGEGPGGARYHYMAIEYIEGRDLGKVLKERARLPEREALTLALSVAQALQHAREHELIHRDVKPSNILLASDGRVLLADLGLARSTAADATRYTITGSALGTPHYISPEQARGEPGIDIRSDIYSLGATLYHMLTGHAPFETKDGAAAVVVAKHLTDELPSPKDVVPELSEGSARLVERMMAKRPRDRHAGPAELAADIERLLAGGSPAVKLRPGLSSVRPHGAASGARRGEGAPGTRWRARREGAASARARRKKLILQAGLGAMCAAILAGALAVMLGGKKSPRRRPPRPPVVPGADEAAKDSGAALPGGGTVVLQQGRDGYQGVDDAMIEVSSPDRNYGDHKEVRAIVKGGSVKLATLIRFDLCRIPAGSTVKSAALEIYLMNKHGSGNFCIGTMGADWKETEATWNEAKAGSAWPGGGAVANAAELLTAPQGVAESWISFEVTPAVRAWIDGSRDNFGFCIWPDGSVNDRFWSSDYAGDAALRPRLTVTYSTSGPRRPKPRTEPVAAANEEPGAEWIAIFTRSDIEGSGARIEDGELVAEEGTDLYHPADWGEFVLEGEIRADGGRAAGVLGLYLAQPQKECATARLHFVFHSDGDVHLWAGGERLWKSGLGKFPLDRWTRLRIELTRGALRLYKDGRLEGNVDISQVRMKTGGVGFSSQGSFPVRMRNVRARPLAQLSGPPEEEWLSICNGRDLTGWKCFGKAYIEDGAVVSADNADLFYKADWSEFILACELKGGAGGAGFALGLGLAHPRMGRGSSRVRVAFTATGDVHVFHGKEKLWRSAGGELPLDDWLPVRLELTRDSLKVYSREELVGTVDLSQVPAQKGGIYFYSHGPQPARMRNARVRVLAPPP